MAESIDKNYRATPTGEETPQAMGKLHLLFGASAPTLEFVKPTETVAQAENDTEQSSAEDVDYRYPDIKFQFDQSRLVGTNLIPASEGSRFRAVVHALRDGWEGYAGLNTEIAAAERDEFKKFSSAKVSFQGVEKRRSDLLTTEEALAILSQDLNKRNDPVRQALNQLAIEYPQLGEPALRKLSIEVLTAMHTDELKDIYNRLTQKLRDSYTDKN